MKMNLSADTKLRWSAWGTTLAIVGAFLPVVAISNALVGAPGVGLLLQYALPMLAVVLLLIGGVASLWKIRVIEDLAIAVVSHTINFKEVGWRRAVLINGASILVLTLLLGVLMAAPVWTVVVSAVLVSLYTLTLFGFRFKNRDRRENDIKRIERSVAVALLDHFSPKEDFMVILPGERYVDEEARLLNARSHITSIEMVADGEYVINIRNNVRNKTDKDLLKRLESLEANMGLYKLSTVDEDARAGYVVFRIWTKPVKTAITKAHGKSVYAEALQPSPKAIAFGIDEAGAPVTLGLNETNTIIAGQPGTGKSGTIASVLTEVAQIPHVALVGFDPKQVELGLWSDRFSQISIGDCCFPFMLRALYQEMLDRYTILHHYGLKKVTPDMWGEYPLVVLVLDELARVFADPDNPMVAPQKSENYNLVRKIVAEGRAAGFVTITATQRPSADLVPTSLRNLIQQRVVHSTSRETDTNMILGEVQGGTFAHTISPSEKGVGYVLDEGSRVPLKLRSSLVMSNDERASAIRNRSTPADIREIAKSNPTIEEMVAATKHLRVALPCLDNNIELNEHIQTSHVALEEMNKLRLNLS